jgi:hypothetical protein
MNWLFNFSASPVGGGLRRLEETAKWFDQHGGATFLVHARTIEAVSRYATCNRYIGVRLSKLRRFIADGRYLPGVIREIGIPDVYFSYGIPLFFNAGRINWIHVSNALTLTRDRHGMPIKRHLELQLVGRRMVHSLRYAHIASAESQYALDLLQTARGNPGGVGKYVVIDNGCEEALFNRPEGRPRADDGKYAITVGTAPYKRLGQALAVFGLLQKKHPDLRRFKIVGDKSQIPRNVLGDARVEALGTGIANDDLYDMIEGASCYISASGIENSSIAVTEALLLSPSVVLSDIPSHREAVRAMEWAEICVPGEGVFIEVSQANKKAKARPPSWSDVLQRVSDTVLEFSRTESG